MVKTLSRRRRETRVFALCLAVAGGGLLRVKRYRNDKAHSHGLAEHSRVKRKGVEAGRRNPAHLSLVNRDTNASNEARALQCYSHYIHLALPLVGDRQGMTLLVQRL